MTRSKLSWSDLRGVRAGVWGLGREGMANLRKLRSLEAGLVLVDDSPAAADVGGIPVVATEAGGHRGPRSGAMWSSRPPASAATGPR